VVLQGGGARGAVRIGGAVAAAGWRRVAVVPRGEEVVVPRGAAKGLVSEGCNGVKERVVRRGG
jgi:hypothetical protein